MRFPKNMPRNPRIIIARPTNSRYHHAVVSLATAAADAGQSHQLPAHQAHQQDAVQDADQPQIEPHVAVEDVAELVGDHALQLVARKLLDAPARDADHGVARREAGREGVDALFVLQHEHRRHRHAGREGHFLDDVQQPPLVGLDRVRIDAPAAQPLGDARAAARELSDLEQTPAGDQRERSDGRADRNLPRGLIRPKRRACSRATPPSRPPSPQKRRHQNADHRQARTPTSATWYCGGQSTDVRRSRWPWGVRSRSSVESQIKSHRHDPGS